MRGWRQIWLLALLFAIALPVFIWVRWEPASRVDAWVVRTGLPLRISGVEKRWPGLRLHDVVLQLQGIAPLRLKWIDVAPAWRPFLEGNIGLDIRFSGPDAQGIARIIRRGGQLYMQFIDMRLGPRLLPQFPGMPKPGGEIRLKGDVSLDMRTQAPTTGFLVIQWLNGAIQLGDQAVRLGDYRLEIRHGSDGWRWQVGGGTIVEANGNGKLVSEGRPESWHLWGHVTLAGPGLLTGRPGKGGARDRIRLDLGGTLMRPSIRLRADGS